MINRYRIYAGLASLGLASIFCTSQYITPGSVAATGSAEELDTPPTAFFIAPSESPVLVPSPTPTPVETSEVLIPTASPSPVDSIPDSPPILYSAQAGDSLEIVAIHFGVNPIDITSPNEIGDGLIPAGQILIIPNVLDNLGPSERLIPDSEIIYSPSAIGFNAEEIGETLDGHLAEYQEYLSGQWFYGGQVIEKAALENSINPRTLMSLLEYQTQWLLSSQISGDQENYPMGYVHDNAKGLYSQTIWAVRQLSVGYYGWKEGRITELVFPDGERRRIAPELNAGTVAIHYLFSQIYNYDDWLIHIDKEAGFPALHASLFPDPWIRAAQIEPILTSNLVQPELSLPFFGNNSWSYSSGPHGAWDRLGSLAALDFAPSSALPGCVESEQWITAAGSGLVVRTGTGVVVLDLDGDGNEQTGWVLLYLHVSQDQRVEEGDWLDQGDLIGFPSCEGGFSTASHLHISRKYNGEWIHAGGPIPFNLSGWVAEFDGIDYQGRLVRGEEIKIACTCGNPDTLIRKTSSDPY
jgi:LysM repeat protein